MDQRALVVLIIISSLGIAGILLSEKLRRRGSIKNETARKFVHMLHALAVSVWAYFLPALWPLIVVETASLALVVAAKHLNIFSGFRKVGRVSYGDLLLPIGVIIVCLFSPTYPQFLVVMLHAGLADALAAIVGKRVKSKSYNIFAQTKTFAGSATFFAVSCVTFMAYLAHSGRLDMSMLIGVVVSASIVTAAEAMSVYGTDNLAIPLITLLMLRTVL